MEYEEEIVRRHNKEVEYISFPNLEKTEIVKHAISTRIGGVSEGIFSSMNFSILRGDSKENVLENYKRMADILDTSIDKFVCSDQTHTINVKRVTARDAGKGTILEKDYQNIDALITNDKDITLVIYFADCVPVLFVDPVHKAIGMAHSGWRGTVAKIGQEVLKCMKNEFETNAEEVICAIGPSICQKCYEVDKEVADRFKEAFSGKEKKLLKESTKEGKYLLDLWAANREVLLEGNVRPENISISGLCTCCNPDYLFSHRASHGKRGIMGAFMKLS